MFRFSSQSAENNAEMPHQIISERHSDLNEKLVRVSDSVSPNTVVSPLPRSLEAQIRYSYEAEFVYNSSA